MAFEENREPHALAGYPTTEILPHNEHLFTHIDTWIFDLDNTLYSHETRLWPQVDNQITYYISELFGIDALSARALQKYYYQQYGSTLRGLMAEQSIDPHDFLEFAHDIDYSAVVDNERLREVIAQLPGRRFVLTNGSCAHAAAVTEKLGIAELFDDTFDIVAAAFIPKPEEKTYMQFIEKYAIDPKRAAMFEDLSINLAVPHQLGMQTVLVLPATPDPHREAHEQARSTAPYVGHQTTDLAAFLGKILYENKQLSEA